MNIRTTLELSMLTLPLIGCFTMFAGMALCSPVLTGVGIFVIFLSLFANVVAD